MHGTNANGWLPLTTLLLQAGSAVKVLFINCQSGHDSMHMRGQADDMAKLLTLLPCKFPGNVPSTRAQHS